MKKNILQRLAMIICIVLVFTACQHQAETGLKTAQSLGEGQEPKHQEDVDTTEIQRFVREVGPEELKIVMASPNSQSPGLPLSSLLFLIRNIDLDIMVNMVQEAGARKVVNLVYAMKRIGCNQVKDEDGNYKFNIPVTHHFSDCTREDYDHLQLMVDLINGIQDVNKLINVVKGESLVPNLITNTVEREWEDQKFIEKLAYLVIYMKDTQKLISLMNGALDPRDLVYLITLFSTDLTVPVSAEDIDSGRQLLDLSKMVSISKGIENSSKLHQLINGTRTVVRNETEDARQIEFLSKLKPLVEGPPVISTSSSECANEKTRWVNKMTQTMNGVSSVGQMVTLVSGIHQEKIANLADVLCRIDAPNNAAPHNNAINSLIYIVNHLTDMKKMIAVAEEADPVSMANVLNATGIGSQVDDEGAQDAFSAGKKLVSTLENINDISKLSYVINNVSNSDKLSALINAISIADTAKVAQLMNQISGESTPVFKEDFANFSLRSAATGMGKLVNLIDYAYDLDQCVSMTAKMAEMIQNVHDIEIMASLINEVTNSSNIVGMLNAVFATDPVSDATLDDMIALLNNMTKKTIPKLGGVMNTLGAAVEHTSCGLSLTAGSDQHKLVAQLLGPEDGVNKGVGYQTMVTLMENLPSNSAANGLATMMTKMASYQYPNDAYNGMLRYNSPTPNITKREGIVRLLRTEAGTGVVYPKTSLSNPTGKDVLFPGIGPVFMGSSIIGDEEKMLSLVDIVNNVNLTDTSLIIGCQDAISIPDFKTPCCQIKRWQGGSCER